MGALSLGPRLQAVADRVPVGARVADVGSDHGRLPAWLVETGGARRAWALDVARGPVSQLRRMALPAAVEVRQGDGLAPLRPGEADAVTICGMGGHTVARIIMDAPAAVVAGLVRWVLQPNDHPELVRAAVVARGWAVADEALVRERGRWYPVVVAERQGWRAVDDPLAWRLGPVLLERRDPALVRWLHHEHAHAQAVLAKAPQATRMAHWSELTAAGLARLAAPRTEPDTSEGQRP